MYGRYLSTNKAADADLRTRVKQALSLSRRPGFAAIEPSVLNGRVVLRGSLPDRLDCELALLAARRVAGADRVVDRLRSIVRAATLPAPALLAAVVPCNTTGLSCRSVA